MSTTADVRAAVLDELRTIERQHDVRILYACESGSRAWGFPSPDSDYDVRFVYVRPANWYLSIDTETRRDVIERPVGADAPGAPVLDVNGWDLRKALRLLRKSNPPLLEWLRSPIVYHDDGSRALLLTPAAAFAAKAGVWHYWHMARGNYRDYLEGETVWVKKYLYVVRPLLAARYVVVYGTPPPVDVDALIQATVHERDLCFAIHALLARKRAGDELDRGPRDPVLDRFIATELDTIERAASSVPSADGPNLDALNSVFRGLVTGAWETAQSSLEARYA